MDLPRPELAALHACRDLTNDLSQWAPTVHHLVWARIDALEAAHGPRNHPTETDTEYAMRVLAQGQYPFPRGESCYDSDYLNRGYDHIEISHGLGDDNGTRITFTGYYPAPAATRTEPYSYRAKVHCPGWLVTDPDGIERFEARTAAMVSDVIAENEQMRQRISAALEQMLAEHRDSPPAAT